MKEWFSDAVAIILAIGVSTSLILLSVVEFSHSGHLTPDETVVISTVLGAGIGALATHIGGKSDKTG